MLELLKVATLVGILVSDVLKMRRDLHKIKQTPAATGLRMKLIRAMIALMSAAPPVYYALELKYCLMNG